VTDFLTGKVVAITGAGRGIGRAVALACAAEGAAVVVNDYGVSMDGSEPSSEIADAVVAEIESAGGSAVAVADDISTMAAGERIVQTAIDTYGRLDGVVCVAGILRERMLFNMSEDEWDAVIALNMKTAFLCAQAVVKPMMERKSGRIINIGSQAAIAPAPASNSFLPYAAAKAGLIGFSKHLAKQLGPYGITVNAISPSTTLTARARKNRDAAAIERLKAQNPMKTLVEVEDTAQAAVFLASNEARYITGVNLNVNAGTLIV